MGKGERLGGGEGGVEEEGFGAGEEIHLIKFAWAQQRNTNTNTNANNGAANLRMQSERRRQCQLLSNCDSRLSGERWKRVKDSRPEREYGNDGPSRKLQ